MPTSISRDEVQRLIGEGAHLVEVLPPTEYEEMHLPGAMNIPLKTRLRSARRHVTAALQDSATFGSASCSLSSQEVTESAATGSIVALS